eukprot:274545-Rhodomonas_salina.1
MVSMKPAERGGARTAPEAQPHSKDPSVSTQLVSGPHRAVMLPAHSSTFTQDPPASVKPSPQSHEKENSVSVQTAPTGHGCSRHSSRATHVGVMCSG